MKLVAGLPWLRAGILAGFLGLLSGCATIPETKSPMLHSGRTMGPIEYGVREDGTIEIGIPRFFREFMERMIRKEIEEEKSPKDSGGRSL